MNKKQIIKISKRALDILFADAKLTWERLVCICSALFWIWLEIMFVKFFFTFAFGIVAYVSTSSYALTWETLVNNYELRNALTIGIVLIITVFRLPLFKYKTIKK